MYYDIYENDINDIDDDDDYGLLDCWYQSWKIIWRKKMEKKYWFFKQNFMLLQSLWFQ